MSHRKGRIHNEIKEVSVGVKTDRNISNIMRPELNPGYTARDEKNEQQVNS